MSVPNTRSDVVRKFRQVALVFTFVLSLAGAAMPAAGLARSDSGVSVVVIQHADARWSVGLVECLSGQCSSQRMAVLVNRERQKSSLIATMSGQVGFIEP